MNEIVKLVQQPAITELNEKHCVVKIGGKTRVMEWKEEFGRLVPEYYPFEDFRNYYMNRSMKVGQKMVPLGKWWLEHPDRRQYAGVVYRPDLTDKVVNGCLNLWTGFAIEPKQGDWSLMQRHIKEVIADGNEKIDTYVTKWSAWKNRHVRHEMERVDSTASWCTSRGRTGPARKKGGGKRLVGADHAQLLWSTRLSHLQHGASDWQAQQPHARLQFVVRRRGLLAWRPKR